MFASTWRHIILKLLRPIVGVTGLLALILPTQAKGWDKGALDEPEICEQRIALHTLRAEYSADILAARFEMELAKSGKTDLIIKRNIEHCLQRQRLLDRKLDLERTRQLQLAMRLQIRMPPPMSMPTLEVCKDERSEQEILANSTRRYEQLLRSGLKRYPESENYPDFWSFAQLKENRDWSRVFSCNIGESEWVPEQSDVWAYVQTDTATVRARLKFKKDAARAVRSLTPKKKVKKAIEKLQSAGADLQYYLGTKSAGSMCSDIQRKNANEK